MRLPGQSLAKDLQACWAQRWCGSRHDRRWLSQGVNWHPVCWHHAPMCWLTLHRRIGQEWSHPNLPSSVPPDPCSWWECLPCCSAQLAIQALVPWSRRRRQTPWLSQRFQADERAAALVASGRVAKRCGHCRCQHPCGKRRRKDINYLYCIVSSFTFNLGYINNTHLPSMISMVMARDTTSLEARSLAEGAYLDEESTLQDEVWSSGNDANMQ